MAAFQIDPRILSASRPLASLQLCDVRLQEDGRWPWLVLIPRKPGARELEHLNPTDLAQLMNEMVAAGAAVRAMGAAAGRPVEKLNVGALGNRVEQLHVHVVGRRGDDPAWPDPVWGFGQAAAYADPALSAAAEAALPAFEGLKQKSSGPG